MLEEHDDAYFEREAAAAKARAVSLRRMHTRQQMLEGPAANRPQPPGLGSLGKALWHIFCVADSSGDGRLNKREFYEALDFSGASLSGELSIDPTSDLSEKLAAYRSADGNHDGFMDWNEFYALGRLHPQIADMYRGRNQL